MVSSSASETDEFSHGGGGDSIVCDDDDGTVFSDTKTKKGKNEQDALAKNETRGVNCVRAIMILLLIGVAVTSSYFAYDIATESEQEIFENTFFDQATKVTEAFAANADRRMSALQSFSQMMTTHATSTEQTFPFVTVSDFERQAAYALKLSDSPALLTFPIITKENRSAWELYANASQGWISDSLEAQAQLIGTVNGEDEAITNLREDNNYDGGLGEEEGVGAERQAQGVITPIIFKIDQNGEAALETGDGPYAPIWQHAPMLPVPLLVNFNSYSHPTRYRELALLSQTASPLLSSAADFRDNDPLTANRKEVMNLFLNRWQNGTYEYEEGPVSDVYFPVFDSNGEDKQIKSVLTAYVYWQSFFQNILPEDAVGVRVVLQNSCNQSFSYEINGATATYLGKGDFHNPEYDYMMVETGYGAVLGSAGVPEGVNSTSSSIQCFYNVKVFPSEATKEEFTTDAPMIFAGSLAVIFVFTSMVFVLYDWCVGRRHRKVQDTAVKSGAVVRSLFPAKVVDRLYETAENKASKHASVANTKTAKANAFKSGQSHNMITESRRDLNTGQGNDYGDIETSDPIADLYPDCTVFFADIAGFTKWSSNRQPTEVFRFLETLYSTFDKAANSRDVFKVETIGDCYVAVTGLPHRQPNHALRMVKFGAECMMQMNQVIHKMAPVLGGDTLELSLRCGLHSGPVTAGILRGEKARFQLFGDTVNTAARMESTCLAGQIQVSEATAILLRKRGKSSWLRLREDVVAPKGKGAMTTYWIDPKGMDAGATESMVSSDHNSDPHSSGPPGYGSPLPKSRSQHSAGPRPGFGSPIPKGSMNSTSTRSSGPREVRAGSKRQPIAE